MKYFAELRNIARDNHFLADDLAWQCLIVVEHTKLYADFIFRILPFHDVQLPFESLLFRLFSEAAHQVSYV